MSMSLFPGKIHCLRSSLPLIHCRSTTLSSSNAPSQPLNPKPYFPVGDYLVQSCGLSFHEALKASKSIQHLKSPDNPDAVLRFLREIGVSKEDIRTAVSLDPLILCSHVDNNWRSNVTKLQELGCSVEYISGLITRRPYLFRINFAPKLEFWMQALGSTELLLVVLRSDASLLRSSLEKVVIPNVSFLKEECGLSPPQIVRLIKSNPRLITSKPLVLKRRAERAEQLGIARSSKLFAHALIICSYLNQDTIDARLENLRNLGFSQEEVALLIRKLPLVLNASEEVIARKVEFLSKEAGCDIADVLRNPFLLTLSLENRLIPRTAVRNLLTSKGLPVPNLKYASFVKLTEEKFVKRFILPYEQDIPGLCEAYADARKIKVDD